MRVAASATEKDGVEQNKLPLGVSIAMFIGAGGTSVDETSVVYEVRRQEDGATVQLYADKTGAARFTPRETGTYLIHATFMSWDCSGGYPTESQRRGPFTTADITRVIVAGDPPKAVFHAFRLPKGYLPGIPFGSARLVAMAQCDDVTGTVKPITSILRYTTNGRRPTVHSPTLRATGRQGCREQDGQIRDAQGAWGRISVSSIEGGDTLVTVTPGHVLRVWFELRMGKRVLGATRTRSRERNGLQRWVRDTGRCPGAPGGCASIH